MSRHPLDEKTRALRRMKSVALAALFAAVALLGLSLYMGRQGVWGWLGAFAEAATVGALADWFAVTALFRHPLGLPIPHTAIIPRNRQRLADALAQFVRDKFLDKEVLLQRMAAYNLAQKLGVFLSQPGRLPRLTQQMREWLASTVAALDNPELEQGLLDFVRKQLQQWNAAPTAAQLVQFLTLGDHHQRVLNASLEKIAEWIGTPTIRQLIAERMVAMARQQYPKIVWMTDKLDYTEDIAAKLAAQLAQSLVDEVQTVLATPEHPLRQHYAAEISSWLQRLQTDPALQSQVQQFKDQLLNHPALQDYVQRLWQRGRQWLQQDLRSADSALAAGFMRYATALSERLQHNPAWQNALNSQLQVLAWHLADHLRVVAPEHIRRTMQAWDDKDLVNEIERHVGRDLQFIRLNGTIIGGLIGVLIYAITHFGMGG
ncbi:MAG: DUF445 domain-containing protein [Brachymonas sp.]|nr:DUF445 domain-containing protein [Brachymonas sp.]